MASTSTPSGGSSPALRRLQRDLKELQDRPVPDVAAGPVNDNLFKWSATLMSTYGRWKGRLVHLHLDFPSDYPLSPPQVTCESRIYDHPNIFGTYICLDMLTKAGEYAAPYMGWSSGYTVSSILQQLMGFLLMDDSIEQEYGYSVSRGSNSRGAKIVEEERRWRREMELRRAQARGGRGPAAAPAPAPKRVHGWDTQADVDVILACRCGFHELPNGGKLVKPKALAEAAAPKWAAQPTRMAAFSKRVREDPGAASAQLPPAQPPPQRNRFRPEREPAVHPREPGESWADWAARVAASRQAAPAEQAGGPSAEVTAAAAAAEPTAAGQEAQGDQQEAQGDQAEAQGGQQEAGKQGPSECASPVDVASPSPSLASKASSEAGSADGEGPVAEQGEPAGQLQPETECEGAEGPGGRSVLDLDEVDCIGTSPLNVQYVSRARTEAAAAAAALSLVAAVASRPAAAAASAEGPPCSGPGAERPPAAPGLAALAGPASEGLLELLDDFVVRQVLGNLGARDLLRTCQLGGRVARVARDVLQRRELVCFHSKLGFAEGLLGFGVARSWHHSSSQLKGLSCRADYVSWEAFRDGARLSAWNVPFDAFLPLYLNLEHGPRCLAALPGHVRALRDRSCRSGAVPASSGPRAASPEVVDAAQLLEVLGHLLNSLVVEMMGGEGATAGEAGVVSRAMSDAALQSFCHLHHLLLAVALQPGSRVVAVARADVRAFMLYPEQRHKDRAPNLGLLLVELLLVSAEEAPWRQFAPALLREVLARHVMWAVRADRSFGAVGREVPGRDGASGDDQRRFRAHWSSAQVSIRLVMLQAWFANALARPKRRASARDELAAIKAAYDECSGLPPARAFGAFNAHAREVVRCGSWVGALSALRLGFRRSGALGPRATFAAVLRQAVLDSYVAGYHRAPAPLSLVQMRQGKQFVDWGMSPIGITGEEWV